jgi:Holliday junction resolvase RusA-like endonuclease
MTARWFVLDVNPEPWAIGPVGYSRRGGKMSAYVGRNQQLDAYKEAVREALGNDHVMIEGKVKLRFYFWRNRAEYTTPQSRTHRKHEADATNMQKATEDALQGILFKNDKDVNDVQSIIVEQGGEVEGRIVIMVEESHDLPDIMGELPQSVCELLDALDGDQPQLELDVTNDKYSSAPDTF